ncbi:MAG: Thiosulfate sulfurtransferase PspE precursor [Spirochaetes bacterium ADurb.Bin315]|jgi:phage shock protein E|nr:rhodanese-like domain-containing protein [Spirochaetota bacterium]OQA42036.1 MAG: Thiosulfate sulfurtransferase PspE precursor [Spirochaetes bacterium ADurb.Bin315]HOE90147.1 rhodanese-like domain-containing protein [Sphaerochaeta sp.]
MNRIILYALILMILFLIVKKVGGGARISAKDVYALLQSGEEVILVDVRTEGEYYSGHIDGAIHLSLYDIGAEKPALLSDLDAPIIVYCQSGARSGIARRKLKALGYTNVRDMGGLMFWRYDLVK